jgi:DNA polymerase-3 subunit epsilon
LPTFYYHEHFTEMLDFVASHYAHVLEERQANRISEFRSLSREAQCLYVRLVNRKGRVFAVNKIHYPEIGDSAPLIAELRRERWVTPPAAKHFADLLQFLTRSEIYDVLLERFTGMSRSLKKAELINFAREHCGADEFVARIDFRRFLVQAHTDDIRFILFLYFGRIQDSLTQFTMRDLGLVRTQDFKETYEPRFADRTEAGEHYFFARRLHDLRSVADDGLEILAVESADWPEPEFSGSAAIRDRLAYELGRRLEKCGRQGLALSVYRKGESTRCSEKLIRLLLAGKNRDDAESYLERCLENPRSDEEWLVANDIYERKFNKKRTSALTDLLRESTVLDIDESWIGAPELAAIQHYENRGMQAFRAENTLWRMLFGLLFWEELFTGEDAAVHSPFEFLPSSLTNGTFLTGNRDKVQAKLAMFDDKDAVRRAILKTSTLYFGTANGVFRWRQATLDALFALLEAAPGSALRATLERFCDDYRAARYGYPDLLVIDGEGPRFVEIKSEGDQLRRKQWLRIEQLRAAGLPAEVVRLRWVIDPDQPYVVVDVETTGGKGENHRITEIGAVKVQNGRIVDKFQALLNPQRAIPPGISRLTGITQEMVASAPYFADIADDFESFMANAIFVAHNVEFDYGFIAREFARIGRAFRHPKLCTCASMRKLYPGHKSYSLDALARAYDIPLKQHHRALCDAEAAAELLLLINEKREERIAAG